MSVYYQRTRHLMGTSFEITTYGPKEVCQQGMDLAFAEIARLEKRLSIFDADSAIAKINRLSKKGILPVDPEVGKLLALSLQYARITSGAFDPTAGPFIRLWRKGAPAQDEITAALQSVGHQHLVVDKTANRLALRRNGMALDLGAIGKGYAIDRAVSILRQNGVTCALVSCRSTIYGLGKPPFRPGWPVAIQHPRQSDGILKSVWLFDQAISTSGDYEQSGDPSGGSCHVFDPRTGLPVIGTASATVMTDTATAADAFSTAMLVDGERGLTWLAKIGNTEGYLVLDDIGEMCTPGWGQVALSRRSFLAACALGFIAFFLPRIASATVVYATQEEALTRMMPEADRLEAQNVSLLPEQLALAQEMSGKQFSEKNYTFWLGKKEEAIVGYAVRLDVVGKERPITFLVGINPNGTIYGMEVLIYRESEGSQIRYGPFMRQFQNKSKTDSLQLGRDIQSISGATLSSRAAAYAAKKGLALFTVLYQP